MPPKEKLDEEKQRCLICYFFRLNDNRNILPVSIYHLPDGYCHRYAPRPSLEIEINSDPMWPSVSEDDWCGEWKSK